MEASPNDHPNRAFILGNLGVGLYIRYQQTGNLRDLEAAIAGSKATVEATPENHPD